MERTYRVDGRTETTEPTESAAVDYPIVDNGADDPAENVTVVGEDALPAGGVLVELEDRGGERADRVGRTGPEGRIRFVEDVGPPPCNGLTVELPETGESLPLGCHDGGTALRTTLLVGGEGTETGDDDVPDPVIDNGGGNPDRRLTIDLTVVDAEGDPLGDEHVLLLDRGGAPDDREGRTGPGGRIRFVGGVGPPPCNTQTVVVPEYDAYSRLGCKNGGKRIEETIVVGG